MGQRFGGTVDDPKAARYSSGNCWRPKGWPSVLTCPAPPSCVWAEQGGAGWSRSLGGIRADISTGAGIAREGAPWSAPIGALKGPEEGRKPPSKIFPRILDTPRFLRIIHLLSAGVAQLVERNLAKVEVASSRLVSRSTEHNLKGGAIAKWLCTGLQIRSRRFDSASRLHAGVAQLVERNLAKVEVASSRLVSRSTEHNLKGGAIAKWLCTGLQIRSRRFDSASRLHAGVAQLVERNLAKVEVASSRLVSRSRTSKRRGSSRSFPFFHIGAGVTKLVAVADLKSAARWAYGFESRSRHQQR